MDVEGLGERLCHRLVDIGLVESLADLYRIEKDDLTPLEGFAEKSADNLVAAIEASKDRPLSRLLFALGIQHVGKTVAETIVEHVTSIDELADADPEDLHAIDGIGPTIAESVADWFDVPENRALVAELKEVGVNVERKPHEAPPEAESSLPLSGLTVVITGSLPDRTRSEASEALERAGASVTSSVSGNTDVLVVGENPGSKLQEAEEEGATILRVDDPAQFERFVEEGLPERS
jgi:DNA ligase (NAD+)